MSLLQEALQGLSANQEAGIKQQTADRICREMRGDAVRLLETEGERVGPSDRNPLLNRLGRLSLAILFLPYAVALRISPFDYIDSKIIERTIDYEGVSLEATLVAETAIPSRSPKISVRLKGLEEEMVLLRDRGEIWKDTKSGYVTERRANLEDADRFREDIMDRLTGVYQPN